MTFFELNKDKLPETVDEAVEALLAKMPTKDKSQMARMDAFDPVDYHLSLGMFVRNNFGLWSDGSPLLEDCRKVAGDPELDVDSASMLILEKAWEKVKAEYGLRLV